MELIEMVDRYHPDIVFTDIRMPQMDGYQATAHITQKHPHIGVIALSMAENDYSIRKMLQAGARGYLQKNANPGEIGRAIEKVYGKENYISPNAYLKLMKVCNQYYYSAHPQIQPPAF